MCLPSRCIPTQPPVAAALVTAIASLLVALASGALLRRRQKQIAKLEHESRLQLAELDHQLRERKARSERELEAEKVLTRYREPLVAASYDLQRRLTTSSRRSSMCS